MHRFAYFFGDRHCPSPSRHHHSCVSASCPSATMRWNRSPRMGAWFTLWLRLQGFQGISTIILNPSGLAMFAMYAVAHAMGKSAQWYNLYLVARAMHWLNTIVHLRGWLLLVRSVLSLLRRVRRCTMSLVTCTVALLLISFARRTVRWHQCERRAREMDGRWRRGGCE